MLRKLIKHEFRATVRVMGPLFLIVLALALGAKASLDFLLQRESFFPNLLGGILLFAFVVGLFALGVMSIVLMVNRFRSNLMADEGYLMLTLPVSGHQLVWSKIIVSSVWFIAATVVIILACILCFMTVGDLRYLFGSGFFRELGDAIRYVIREYGLNVPVIALEVIVLCLLGCVTTCLEFYAALATGYGFPRHKMALSVLFFFVYLFAMQFLSGLCVKILDETPLYDWIYRTSMSEMMSIHVLMGVSTAILLAYGAIYYAITTVMLKKRLNLE